MTIIDDFVKFNSYGRFEILSREVGTLKWIKEGKSFFELPVILNISQWTVNFYIGNIRGDLMQQIEFGCGEYA